jgi:trehalose synthase
VRPSLTNSTLPGHMQEVDVKPMQVERLTSLLSPQRAARFQQMAARTRRVLDGRTVWNVNATAHGGGVAEMLQTLLAYVRGADVDTRWLVLDANPDFFTITKRLHNQLHGEPGDGGPLGHHEHAVVAETLRPNLKEITRRLSTGDIVLLHDPQTAGLIDGLRAAGAHVVWRCHVGRDTPNALTDQGWAFLRPLIEKADAFVFSREAYAPRWCPPEKVHVITPSIDPFSAKNCALTHLEVLATLTRAGLVDGVTDGAVPTFRRRDGASGWVRRQQDLLSGPPLPPEARLVIQVSRWDRLKDMAGVLTGFADAMATLPRDVHLMLAGPDVSGVSDDPEGAEVLAECRSLWRQLPGSAQSRIHLVCLPMDDVDENAHLVNALQRHASVVVQKSLVEGFGLTVTEAMWKASPIVASAVGGIRDQIVDGEHGLLLEDPSDLKSFAEALMRFLDDPELSAKLGAAAHERVDETFLGDRHLEKYVGLFESLLSQ